MQYLAHKYRAKSRFREGEYGRLSGGAGRAYDASFNSGVNCSGVATQRQLHAADAYACTR